MDPYHSSSQSSAHFELNIVPNLNLLNNKIGNKGVGPSTQENLNASNELECTVGMGSISISSNKILEMRLNLVKFFVLKWMKINRKKLHLKHISWY